ncbi:MAG: tripartite tricarboxylate transporter substrate binding protein [Cytophagales bacterium]|nr:tripartite tricarboxylate transporter substrate binding protein [Cytophagales bacterium]
MKKLSALFAMALQAIAGVAYSQINPGAATYPNRPVTLVVPFAPGGGTDIGARLIANKLTQKWGQSVVVDNKGGAGGVVGVEIVAKAKADGYTLLFGNVGTQSINPSLYKKLPYNADTAFAPVSLVAELPFFLMTSPSFAPKTVKDLVAYAKANPDKVTYASSGNGGSPHLSAEVFSAMAAIRMTHVPYKGGGPAMNDLMAGHVNILFASVLESIGHIQAGKLNVMGVTTKTRSNTAPDVPTISESGAALGLQGYESGSWLGILAPAGTPQAIIDKIAADVKEAVQQTDTRDAFTKQGANPIGSTPAQFKALIEADRKRYAKIIDEKKISID